MNKTLIKHIQLPPSLAQNQGQNTIRIAIIDGAVDSRHDDFSQTKMVVLGQSATANCHVSSSPSCQHGTFVAGIIAAHRQSVAPGMVPDCSMLVRPVFCEASDLSLCLKVTEDNLANAIDDCIVAGANIINMSVGLIGPQTTLSTSLHKAYQKAQTHGVLLVAASGNQASNEVNAVFKHPWVIAVAAMDNNGNKAVDSNGGAWVAQNGLLAPGCNIVSTCAGGGHRTMSGSSVAAPFVTGALALLWRQYPQATANQLRRAILQQRNLSTVPNQTKPSVKPLNVTLSNNLLARLINRDRQTQHNRLNTSQESSTMNNIENVGPNPAPVAITASDDSKMMAQQMANTAPATQATTDMAVQPGDVIGQIQPQNNQCSNCHFSANSPVEYVYAVGRLRPHFPTLGLEKEYEAVARMTNTSPRDYHSIFTNHNYNYIAEQVSWIMAIDGQDAYVLLPNSNDELNAFIDTLKIDEQDNSADEKYTVAIGVSGPVAPQELHDELAVPMVMCYHAFHFTKTGLLGELSVDNSITTSIRDVFNTLTAKPNLGVSAIERAKNFVAYRYSSIYTNTLEETQDRASGDDSKTAEDSGRFLAALDAKMSDTSPGRSIVDIIFTYQKNVSGRKNTYYVSVDVTDQFPFLHSNLSDYVAAG